MPDFNGQVSSSGERWYDLHDDWPLIEASIAKQYGIRVRQHKDMPWDEFCTLVSGLMSDTPLGGIVAIRAEKDPKAIKAFSPDQRRIHREWRTKQAQQKLSDPERLDKDMEALSTLFRKMFGKEAR
ncbi:bacteriophage Gp15 protein [Paenibacillus cellulosilyticus]|uniref:Bacteriophage Gp15 protein n=1 Tax=Paenibacillus cellulosilyticus TaxID=375489 RepID=A0A2V2YNT8_9BACL|nr:Gp15 family bacteriophage protein [Paenibacillus cellulosilyticus]PWV97436.1 bacteriophage Gp15 protein [Paenibacillus cellulosilyticus]QKS48525.1 hypothetical protein HUB94_30285 [Paenibacillus cellulosilyticus]